MRRIHQAFAILLAVALERVGHFVQGGRHGVTLHAPKGMALRGDTLWVADIDALHGFHTWEVARRRMLFVTFDPLSSRVYAMAPGDTTRTQLAIGKGKFDGIEVLPDGRILYSSWSDSSVHVLEGDRDRRVIFPVAAAADIGVDTKRNRVIVPVSMSDRVEIWQLPARRRLTGGGRSPKLREGIALRTQAFEDAVQRTSPTPGRAPRAAIALTLMVPLVLGACKGDDARARVPLDQIGQGAAAPGRDTNAPAGSSLSPTGRAALERGNEAVRAKRYEDALRFYREAAADAPNNAAPYFGIQMAAKALGRQAVADSAAQRLRALSPAAESDPHSVPPAHPPTKVTEDVPPAKKVP